MDETVLSAGHLTEVGVANLKALESVILWQKLSYNFQYHKTDFETNLVMDRSLQLYFTWKRVLKKTLLCNV